MTSTFCTCRFFHIQKILSNHSDEKWVTFLICAVDPDDGKRGFIVHVMLLLISLVMLISALKTPRLYISQTFFFFFSE